MSTSDDQLEGAEGAEGATPARRRPRPIFLVIGVVLAVALAAGLFGVGLQVTGGGSGRPGKGSATPHFALPVLGSTHGKVAVPADGGGGGRPAILLFFASWCSPCQKEIPALAATYRHQEADGSKLRKVALIGVDGNDPTANALAFVHSSGVTFPVGADLAFTVTQTLFDFNYLPEAVFVEGNGTIAGIHYGALSTSAFVSWERKLLAGG
jgi:thiol-disulfide isomerase/thioredoxin